MSSVLSTQRTILATQQEQRVVLEDSKMVFRAMYATLSASLSQPVSEQLQGLNHHLKGHGATDVHSSLHLSSPINMHSGLPSVERCSLYSNMTERSTLERNSCAKQPMVSEHHA